MVNITFKKYKLLIDLYLIRKKLKEFTYTQLAKAMNESPSNPLFHDFFQILKEKNIVKKKQVFGKMITYDLDSTKLDSFIRDTEFFGLTGDFIKSSVPLSYF
ncbi:MAG: helix-turn-helix domain-containing protein [Nanoarchaeota archaeon]